MKSIRPFALLLLPLALAACATTGERSSQNAPAAGSSVAVIQQDAEYVNAVETIARRRGIGVQWVNPPTRRVTRGN